MLDQLRDLSFDPQQSVIVAGGVPAASPGTNANAGTVQITSYAPKDIVLRSDAPAPSVLLLNDRFNPNWNVRVDGKPETVLHCNYIMRGVYLAPGAHTVEFRFQPPVGPMYASLVAVGLGLVLLGYLGLAGRQGASPVRAPARNPGPGGPGLRKLGRRSNALG